MDPGDLDCLDQDPDSDKSAQSDLPVHCKRPGSHRRRCAVPDFIPPPLYEALGLNKGGAPRMDADEVLDWRKFRYPVPIGKLFSSEESDAECDRVIAECRAKRLRAEFKLSGG
eukprot:15433540-Alexandrium_andersonii.AAC.1